MSGGESDALADVLAVVLSGRPERITDLALATEAPEVRAAVASAAEAVAAAALAEEPIAPGAGLRARLMKTLARRASAGAGARKAVLVVDMICDHLEPGRPLEVPRARDIVPALAERLEEARRAGVPVLMASKRTKNGLDQWAADANDLRVQIASALRLQDEVRRLGDGRLYKIVSLSVGISWNVVPADSEANPDG